MSTACASTTSAPADLHQALAAARRLGGRGVPLSRLIAYAEAVDATLAMLPAPCIVCGRTVAAAHIARTGQAIHGDHATRSHCWANYAERRTA